MSSKLSKRYDLLTKKEKKVMALFTQNTSINTQECDCNITLLEKSIFLPTKYPKGIFSKLVEIPLGIKHTKLHFNSKILNQHFDDPLNVGLGPHPESWRNPRPGRLPLQ
jgi:hypothetical protein